MDLLIMMILGNIEGMQYECIQTTLQMNDGVLIDDSLTEKIPLSPS